MHTLLPGWFVLVLRLPARYDAHAYVPLATLLPFSHAHGVRRAYGTARCLLLTTHTVTPHYVPHTTHTGLQPRISFCGCYLRIFTTHHDAADRAGLRMPLLPRALTRAHSTVRTHTPHTSRNVCWLKSTALHFTVTRFVFLVTTTRFCAHFAVSRTSRQTRGLHPHGLRAVYRCAREILPDLPRVLVALHTACTALHYVAVLRARALPHGFITRARVSGWRTALYMYSFSFWFCTAHPCPTPTPPPPPHPFCRAVQLVGIAPRRVANNIPCLVVRWMVTS